MSSSDYEHIKESVQQVLARYKELTGDGKLSWQDMLALLATATATISKLVLETNVDLDAAGMKTMVLAVISDFYDDVIAPIDLQGVPNVIEPIVDRMARTIILNFVGGWIDAALEIFKRKNDPTPVVPGPEPFKPVPFTPYLPMYAKGT